MWGKLQAWRKVLAAYRQVDDSHHLQADCQNWDQLQNPTLGSRIWAAFFYSVQIQHNHSESEDKILLYE